VQRFGRDRSNLCAQISNCAQNFLKRRSSSLHNGWVRDYVRCSSYVPADAGKSNVILEICENRVLRTWPLILIVLNNCPPRFREYVTAIHLGLHSRHRTNWQSECALEDRLPQVLFGGVGVHIQNCRRIIQYPRHTEPALPKYQILKHTYSRLLPKA
jgi:hypothetical protein